MRNCFEKVQATCEEIDKLYEEFQRESDAYADLAAVYGDEDSCLTSDYDSDVDKTDLEYSTLSTDVDKTDLEYPTLSTDEDSFLTSDCDSNMDDVDLECSTSSANENSWLTSDNDSAS